MNIFIPIIIVGVLVIVTFLLILADQFLGAKGARILNINDEKQVEVDEDESVLRTLEKQKIFVPSACGGKASCGFCKVRITSGGGDVKPTEEAFLNQKEKETGVRLSCQVKVRGNIGVEIPDSMLTALEFKAKIVEVRDLTHDIKNVRLQLIEPKTMDFKPGQFCQLKVPGIEIIRAYSISSDQKEAGYVEFIIRYVPKGEATTFVHKAMRVGDVITITGPYGDFYLRDNQKDAVFIAGGSGKAPIRSILLQLKDRGFPRKVRYFFGARTKQDLYYTEELQALEKEFSNFEYIPALSAPEREDQWNGETGLITEVLDRHTQDLSKSEAYLCGSPGMINACIDVLQKHNLKEGNIYFDKFTV